MVRQRRDLAQRVHNAIENASLIRRRCRSNNNFTQAGDEITEWFEQTTVMTKVVFARAFFISAQAPEYGMVIRIWRTCSVSRTVSLHVLARPQSRVMLYC